MSALIVTFGLLVFSMFVIWMYGFVSGQDFGRKHFFIFFAVLVATCSSVYMFMTGQLAFLSQIL